MDEETQRVEETRAVKSVEAAAAAAAKKKGEGFEHAGAGKKEAARKTEAEALVYLAGCTANSPLGFSCPSGGNNTCGAERRACAHAHAKR